MEAPSEDPPASPPASTSAAPLPAAVPAVLVTGSYLRLRGLPFQASDQDIKDFFHGYALSLVLICKRNGRATGEAYVELETAEAAAEALKELNRKHIGRRYIEMFPATEAELEQVKAHRSDPSAKGFILRLRGLPYTATAADVIRFFGENSDITRGTEGVVFTFTPDGRPTGEAYVELGSEEAQKEAMRMHKQMMGSRYIEIFVSSRYDMQQALQQGRYTPGHMNIAARKRWFAQSAGLASAGAVPDTSMLRLQAQPGGYGQNVDDVTEYLKGFTLAPTGAQMLGPPEQGGVQMVPGGMAYLQQPDNMPPGVRPPGPQARFYQGLAAASSNGSLQTLEDPSGLQLQYHQQVVGPEYQGQQPMMLQGHYYVPAQQLQGGGWAPGMAPMAVSGGGGGANWPRGYLNPAQISGGWPPQGMAAGGPYGLVQTNPNQQVYSQQAPQVFDPSLIPSTSSALSLPAQAPPENF